MTRDTAQRRGLNPRRVAEMRPDDIGFFDTLDELEDAYRKGQLKEMFASGTAAIVSPVGELLYKGEHMVINDNKIGPVAQEMYDTIYGIQTGKIEDFMGWTVPVE